MAQRPQPAPKPPQRPPQRPAPRVPPKPATRSLSTTSKPTVSQKPRVGSVPQNDESSPGIVIENAASSISPDGATPSCVVDSLDTTVRPQPRTRKKRIAQKEQPPESATDESVIDREAVLGDIGYDDSSTVEKDKNENIVEERLQSNVCSDGQETNNGDTSVISSESVENIPPTIIRTEGVAVSPQCVKPKVRIKPQVPTKPKPSLWKPAKNAPSENTIEGASNVESLDNKDVADVTLILPDGDHAIYGDSEVPTRKLSQSSLRRSGSYEAAVISEDFYDDVVCPTQNAAQRPDDSVPRSTDDVSGDDSGLHNTEDYYSELADCTEGDAGESDVEEGLDDEAGGVYSYADMPLGTETEEQPDASSGDAVTKDQKKPSPTGLGASFREFFRLGVKKVKVRKSSNSSFYLEEDAAEDQGFDSAVHRGADSDGSDSDASHDYIYIDDLNEPEDSGDDKSGEAVDGVPPVLQPRGGGTNDKCQSKQENTQPVRPLPRIPRKNRHPLVKPASTVQRSQSDSVPVLPPRKKRDASRKAALDMKIFVQRRKERSVSDDEHEYIIPEGVRESARDESKELSVDDENYLVPHNPKSGEGERRDGEDYVPPENLDYCEGEGGNDDYLIPASINEEKELNKNRHDCDDDAYLMPVSVTVDNEQPNLETCHLTDSESDNDEYVAPGSQCLQIPTTAQQSGDETLDNSKHSSISHDLSSSRVSSELSTDVSSETGGCYSPGSRMSLSHNDLALSRSIRPPDSTLRRQSFPGSATYGNCSLSASDVCGGAYVPMSHEAPFPSSLRYVHSFGHDSESSSFSEAPSEASDYEAVRVHSSASSVVEEPKQRSIAHIVQEIASSEKTFVGVLRFLNETFRSTVERASQQLGRPVLPQSVLDQILKYLPMLQNFNVGLLKDIEERLDNWESNPRIADIFVKKGPFLKLYTSYIREFEMMCNTLEEARRKYPEFDHVATDFEASSQSAGLALKHYMLKPIQRIPQYRMLLQEYKKSLSSDAADAKDVLTALIIVSEVADHANDSMQYRDNVGKLLELQNSLISRCEVIKPGRLILKEGILMKLSRKEMQPRRFILLNDALLYTTQVKGGYKLNNELSLCGMKVNKPMKEAFQNEFSIITTKRSFTISARTSEERDEWLEALQDAIEENRKKRYTFNLKTSHLPAFIEMDADFKLGSRAPVWIPDVRVSMCMLCTAEFTITFRRHHCRACGKVVCRMCSDYKAPLRYLMYKPDRVCTSCFEQLHKEMTALKDGENDTPDLSISRSFSKSTIKERFHGLGSFGKGKLKMIHRPSVLNEVQANADDVDISGYLNLWRKRTKRWRPLWFVLKGKAFYTYKASEDTAARKSTVLLGYEVQPLTTYYQGVESNLLFQLVHRGMNPMVFQTDSQSSRERWMSALLKATVP